MKVIQVVDSLNLGGTERMAVNIANVLADDGFDSFIVVTRKFGDLYSGVQNNVNIKCFGKRNFFDFPKFFSMFKYIKSINPDFLHVHQTSIYWAFFLKRMLPGVKLIWHDHYGQDTIKTNYMIEMKFFIPSIDLIFTANEKIKTYWEKRFPKRSNNIFYIKNFIIPFTSNKIKINVDNFRILNIANIRKEKNQLNLIESLSIVKSKGYDFTAYLVGSFNDINYLNLIKGKILELDLSSNVKVIGPVKNVKDYLVNSDLAVLS
jgi:glycosyltransferase involved in cell wall biosynthesis